MNFILQGVARIFPAVYAQFVKSLPSSKQHGLETVTFSLDGMAINKQHNDGLKKDRDMKQPYLKLIQTRDIQFMVATASGF